MERQSLKRQSLKRQSLKRQSPADLARALYAALAAGGRT